jgi:hypothetical protein
LNESAFSTLIFPQQNFRQRVLIFAAYSAANSFQFPVFNSTTSCGAASRIPADQGFSATTLPPRQT